MTNEEMQVAMILNEERILRQYKKLVARMEFLKEIIDAKDWRGRGESITEGHFAMDVATMTSLIGKAQTFQEIALMEED